VGYCSSSFFYFLSLPLPPWSPFFRTSYAPFPSEALDGLPFLEWKPFLPLFKFKIQCSFLPMIPHRVAAEMLFFFYAQWQRRRRFKWLPPLFFFLQNLGAFFVRGVLRKFLSAWPSLFFPEFLLREACALLCTFSAETSIAVPRVVPSCPYRSVV